MTDEHARNELDSLVITMELTLMSIIQGIALYFLADSSVDLLTRMQIEWWPYVLVGLLVILLFWSRSLMHILTIIRWPLEFTHNFMYITFTLIESVMFKQITVVQNWYALNVLASVLIWMTFAVDLRMIRRSKTGATTPASMELIDILQRDQELNLRLIVPLMMFFSALACAFVYSMPELFVFRHGHLIFAGSQILFLSVYIVYSLRLYRRIAPLILRQRQEGWS